MERKTIISEVQFKKLIKRILSENENLYFNTFSGAVLIAREYAESKGYTINEDDWWDEINMGPGKPDDGKTTKATIGLSKDGKPQRKALQIQVYNRGSEKKPYELNYYIN